MGIKTAYDGYKAYSYLEPEKDYPYYELADWNWAGEHVLPLDAAQEARVAKLAKDSLIISLHDHPTFFPKDLTQTMDFNREGRDVCAYEALSKSYLDLSLIHISEPTRRS